jgi:hypothetical protein
METEKSGFGGCRQKWTTQSIGNMNRSRAGQIRKRYSDEDDVRIPYVNGMKYIS